MSVFSVTMGTLANVAAVLLAAPFFHGILRKVTAVVQSRQGPPLLQPYCDLLKLLGKEDIESGHSPGMQRFAAYLSLAAVLAVACMVPLGFAAPMSGAGDAILLIYLLSLCGLCTLLAGLAAGSTYSLLGASREMTGMIALEPLLAVAVVAGAVRAGSLRLDAVLNGPLFAGGCRASSLVLLAVMSLAFQAFVQRPPFDIAEAETELMDGPLSEYSGPKLALFKLAQMAKLVVYCALFIALFASWGSALGPLAAWLLFWAKVAVLAVAVTLVGATHARYRIDQAVRYFAGLLAAAMVALGMASCGL